LVVNICRVTLDRVAALKAERAAVVQFLHGLGDDEWARPSRCAGWSIQDVVSHMGAAAHGTFTPWVVKMMTSKDIEAGNDADAARRRDWAPGKVLAEYESWSRRFAATQVLLQKPGLRSLPIRVGEVGTYPAKLLASAIVFDSGLHLRHDIATALGRDVEPRDANRLAVTLEWMLAGLPAMSGDRLDWLERGVELVLLGAGGGTWGMTPGEGGRVRVTEGPARDPGVTIEAEAAGFPEWATSRTPWRSADVRLKGDEDLGTRFLDSARII
jgi:uncharacterized protein (TIGR03083 family)